MTVGRLAALERPLALDRIALPALLVLAAVLRLPNLATRGTWDGDQGHDMLVLRTLVRDGTVPLLGPPTDRASHHTTPTAAIPARAMTATTASGESPPVRAAAGESR